jgi:predicted  nucleic acid-binding Zn-ribbon protein
MIIECAYCGYVWDTSSELDLVTCASCGRKTLNNKRRAALAGNSSDASHSRREEVRRR